MKSPQRSKTKGGISSSVVAPYSDFPEPQDLLREAEKEIGHGDLKTYATVIATLRKKGFSFREIADWLNARGVLTNHNAVYRVFTTCLAHGEADAIEEELQSE